MDPPSRSKPRRPFFGYHTQAPPSDTHKSTDTRAPPVRSTDTHQSTDVHRSVDTHQSTVVHEPKTYTRPPVSVSIDGDTRKIMEALGEDSASKFNGFLRRPAVAPKAIERITKLRYAGFHQTRILALWHLFRKTNCDRVTIEEADRDAVMDYFYEVIEGAVLLETQRHLVNSVDDPSWVWLHALKRLWTPEMGTSLPSQIQRVGGRRVFAAVVPLIQEFHAKNRPYLQYSQERGPPGSTGQTVNIPSQWYRSVLFPMLGGEPHGLFDDTPMSYTETLSSMFSQY